MGRAVRATNIATKVLRERERDTHTYNGMTARKGAFGADDDEHRRSHLTTGYAIYIQVDT